MVLHDASSSYSLCQTIVDQKHWAWRNIFPEGDLFLLSAEEICGSPLPELEAFSKRFCRPCQRRLTNYNNVIATSRKQSSLHATQKLNRRCEVRIFSLPQVVFHRSVAKIQWGTYSRCAIFWHISTWPMAVMSWWRNLSLKKELKAYAILDSPFSMIWMYYILHYYIQNLINRRIVNRKLDLSMKGCLGGQKICKIWNSTKNEHCWNTVSQTSHQNFRIFRKICYVWWSYLERFWRYSPF